MKFRLFTLSILLLFSSICFGENLFSDEEKVLDSQKRKYKIKILEKQIAIPDDIPIYDTDDKKIFFDKFEGKTILVSFWATWCSPCVDEMPQLNVLSRDFRKLPFEIVTISQDFGGIKIVQDFFNKYEIDNLKIYHDKKNQLFRELEIAGLPTNLIIDSEGFIRVILEGSVNWYDDEVRALLFEHIDGNHAMPKNSFKNKSLDIKVKNEIKAGKKVEAISEDKSDNNDQNIDKVDNDESNKVKSNEK